MKITSFLHKVISDLVHINSEESTELFAESHSTYIDVVQSYKLKLSKIKEAQDFNTLNANKEDFKPIEIPTINFNERFFGDICERWYIRYLFAFLSLVVVAWVRKELRKLSENDLEKTDDAASQYAEFLKFQATIKNRL